MADLKTAWDLKLMIVKVQQSGALLFILFGHADEPIFKETRKDRGGRTQDLVSATVEERRGFLISAPVLRGRRPGLGRWPSGMWPPLLNDLHHCSPTPSHGAVQPVVRRTRGPPRGPPWSLPRAQQGPSPPHPQAPRAPPAHTTSGLSPLLLRSVLPLRDTGPPLPTRPWSLHLGASRS